MIQLYANTFFASEAMDHPHGFRDDRYKVNFPCAQNNYFTFKSVRVQHVPEHVDQNVAAELGIRDQVACFARRADFGQRHLERLLHSEKRISDIVGQHKPLVPRIFLAVGLPVKSSRGCLKAIPRLKNSYHWTSSGLRPVRSLRT